MIWKLFRPKPIFVLTIPDKIDETTLFLMKSELQKQMGSQYNIVVIFDPKKDNVETKILK
jgi:hypothetical protein